MLQCEKSRLFKMKSKYFEFNIDKSGQKRYDVLEIRREISEFQQSRNRCVKC